MKTQDWTAIFDWDGVVVDSSDYHEESWERLAQEEGRDLPPDHFKRGFGMKNEHIIPEVLEWTQDADEIARLSRRKEELYRELLREKGIDPLPGVMPFLERLKAASVTCIIASSTSRANISCALEVTHIADDFDGIVSGEDTEKGKPHPEPFLAAAERTGTDPADCVVFEDAHVGVEAGRRAGMKVVGVASTHDPDTLEDADRVVVRLDELKGTDPNRWF